MLTFFLQLIVCDLYDKFKHFIWVGKILVLKIILLF